MLVRRASHPDAQLTPAEAAVRDMRQELLGQVGADPSPAQRHLVDGICVALIVQMTLERYLLRLVGDDGLVNRQSHQTFPIVLEAIRIQGDIARRLRMLGLKPPPKPPQDVFKEHLAAWQADKQAKKRRPSKSVGPPGGGGAPAPPE